MARGTITKIYKWFCHVFLSLPHLLLRDICEPTTMMIVVPVICFVLIKYVVHGHQYWIVITRLGDEIDLCGASPGTCIIETEI